jgi:hypothetical protein
MARFVQWPDGPFKFRQSGTSDQIGHRSDQLANWPVELRHSAISYLAMFPDVGVSRVSRSSGNSEAICRKHYLEVLRKVQGEVGLLRLSGARFRTRPDWQLVKNLFGIIASYNGDDTP